MPLAEAVSQQLAEAQESVDGAADAKAAVEARWSGVRRTKWFREGVTALLQQLAGSGERCMYCSSGEANEVEHFWPKAGYPAKAFQWQNFLWCCGICNGNKGDEFPLLNAEPLMVNPLDDEVWRHLQIDEMGQYVATFDSEGNEDPKGLESTRRLKLNRDALRVPRRERIQELNDWTHDMIRQMRLASLSVAEARNRVERWRSSNIQPDVAAYFLSGPGRSAEPFRTLLALIE